MSRVLTRPYILPEELAYRAERAAAARDRQAEAERLEREAERLEREIERVDLVIFTEQSVRNRELEEGLRAIGIEADLRPLRPPPIRKGRARASGKPGVLIRPGSGRIVRVR